MATQIPADLVMSAKVIANSTGTALTAWAWTDSSDVNGSTRTRLEVQLLNGGTGSSFSGIGVGQVVDIQLEGYLA